MSSGPVAAVVIEGHRCIEGFRALAGATDPTAAAPGTIRGDLGRDWGLKVQQNIVHGSDSPESSAARSASGSPTCDLARLTARRAEIVWGSAPQSVQDRPRSWGRPRQSATNESHQPHWSHVRQHAADGGNLCGPARESPA